MSVCEQTGFEGSPIQPVPQNWRSWLAIGGLLLMRDASRATNLPKLWRKRWVDRRLLLSMDERLIRDIGLRCLDARHEGEKLFWRS